jgi:hypothetical protein
MTWASTGELDPYRVRDDGRGRATSPTTIGRRAAEVSTPVTGSSDQKAPRNVTGGCLASPSHPRDRSGNAPCGSVGPRALIVATASSRTDGLAIEQLNHLPPRTAQAGSWSTDR